MGASKLVGLRLGDHGGAESALGDVARGNDLAQAGHAFGIEERLALVGRAGDEQDELAIASKSVSSHWPGALPFAFGRMVAPLIDVGLLEIVRRHGDAPGCGACMKSGHLRGVATQGEREGFGNGFAGEVVFSGAETAHER